MLARSLLIFRFDLVGARVVGKTHAHPGPALSRNHVGGIPQFDRSPVLFQKTLERLAAEGVTSGVEPAPGRVLAGFAKKAAPGMAVEAFDTADAVEGSP